jgi:hypothetical protein
LSAEVIPFPSNKTDVLDTLLDMLESGEIGEFVIFAPNAKDSGLHHFTATDGITLLHLLMAKQLISRMADKLSD